MNDPLNLGAVTKRIVEARAKEMEQAQDDQPAPKRLCNDWQGVPREMPRPSGKAWRLVRSFDEAPVELFTRNLGVQEFALVHGLRLVEGLDYKSAAEELGFMLIHHFTNCSMLDEA